MRYSSLFIRRNDENPLKCDMYREESSGYGNMLVYLTEGAGPLPRKRVRHCRASELLLLNKIALETLNDLEAVYVEGEHC